MTSLNSTQVNYYIHPLTNNLYAIEGTGGIEGVELKEISQEDYLALQAQQQQQAAEEQCRAAAGAAARHQELIAQIDIGRLELEQLGLSLPTIDLLLPSIANPIIAPPLLPAPPDLPVASKKPTRKRT